MVSRHHHDDGGNNLTLKSLITKTRKHHDRSYESIASICLKFPRSLDVYTALFDRRIARAARRRRIGIITKPILSMVTLRPTPPYAIISIVPPNIVLGLVIQVVLRPFIIPTAAVVVTLLMKPLSRRAHILMSAVIGVVMVIWWVKVPSIDGLWPRGGRNGEVPTQQMWRCRQCTQSILVFGGLVGTRRVCRPPVRLQEFRQVFAGVLELVFFQNHVEQLLWRRHWHGWGGHLGEVKGHRETGV